MGKESAPILPTDILSESIEHPVSGSKTRKRPAPVYDLRLRKKRRKKPINPDDPDDPDNPDDETGEPDDDDDDDETTDSDADDEETGGEEDENELQQIDTRPKQQTHPFQLTKRQPDKNTLTEKPKGPEKTERSPWQQMIDFFVHGVKGAMIKNGDISTKTNLADNIMAGLGFKSFKKDIMLQEQAKEFWKQKGSGKKVDIRLLNTDLIDRKIRAEEKRELQPQKQAEQQRLLRQKDTAQLQRELSERISKQRRDENIRFQIERQSKQQQSAIMQQHKNEALYVAQNGLTRNTSENQQHTTLSGQKSSQTDGIKTVETSMNNPQAISVEQARHRQEQTQINHKHNIEAQQIMAQQAALNAQQTANIQQSASLSNAATTAALSSIQQAFAKQPHISLHSIPRPQDIVREQMHLQGKEVFDPEKAANALEKAMGGRQQIHKALISKQQELSQQIKESKGSTLSLAGKQMTSDQNSMNATLSHSGQVHQETQPEEEQINRGR